MDMGNNVSNGILLEISSGSEPAPYRKSNLIN